MQKTIEDRALLEFEDLTARQEASLIEELRTLLDQSVAAPLQERLLAVVNQLLTILPRQFERKETDGYLHEVTDEFPSWDRQVQALHLQQALLLEKLRELRDQLQQAEEAHDARPALTLWLKVWTECYLQHEEEERRLSQIAVNFDVGGDQG